MGFGDVKLAILLGLVLGFPNILAGLFFAFFLGSVIGSALMILKKKQMKRTQSKETKRKQINRNKANITDAKKQWKEANEGREMKGNK